MMIHHYSCLRHYCHSVRGCSDRYSRWLGEYRARADVRLSDQSSSHFEVTYSGRLVDDLGPPPRGSLRRSTGSCARGYDFWIGRTSSGRSCLLLLLPSSRATEQEKSNRARERDVNSKGCEALRRQCHSVSQNNMEEENGREIEN